MTEFNKALSSVEPHVFKDIVSTPFGKSMFMKDALARTFPRGDTTQAVKTEIKKTEVNVVESDNTDVMITQAIRLLPIIKNEVFPKFKVGLKFFSLHSNIKKNRLNDLLTHQAQPTGEELVAIYKVVQMLASRK